MKALSNSDKIKAVTSPRITDLNTFLKKIGMGNIYTGINIHYLNSYMEMILASTNLTSSSQRFNFFVYTKNNYTNSLQLVIEAVRVSQNIIS